MSRFLVVCALGCAFAIVGCQNNPKHDNGHMESTDACSHCPGNQTKTAEGNCSACGMQMKA